MKLQWKSVIVVDREGEAALGNRLSPNPGSGLQLTLYRAGLNYSQWLAA